MQKRFIFILIALLFFQNIGFSQNKIDSTKLIKREQQINKVSVIKNNDALPIYSLEQNISYHKIQTSTDNIFLDYLKRYALVSILSKNSDLIIISIFEDNKSEIEKLELLFENETIILCLFGNFELMNKYQFLDNAKAIIISKEKTEISQDIVSQIIFGGISSQGKLYKTINTKYKKNLCLKTKGQIRFEYTIPEAVGYDSAFIYQKIDSIANYGISQNGYPGCQVFFAKEGKVFFNKSYGYHTYDSLNIVQNTDLYDIASVTKITAPLPCLMKLNDEGKFDIDEKFSKYWKPFRRSNKKDLIVRDILCHQGQLVAWIPFWKMALKEDKTWKNRTFRQDSNRYYNIKVSENLFLYRKFYKKVFKKIKKSDILEEKKYKYSDMSFYLYPKIIEKITGENYETYLYENFYTPLGASSVTYNPLEKYSKNEIVPTENDRFFRKEQIHGRVHDEGAILLGGISGHAGIFANANDLAKVIQMYLNYGEYGGKRYLQESTLKEWTSYQFEKNENRRGIGFDKPMLKNKNNGTPSPDASDESFGHTGFTGTFVWADPENKLLIVFLSNRVFPTRENKNLWRKNIRTSIHQELYDQLK